MAFDWTQSGRTEWLSFETYPVTTKSLKSPTGAKALNTVRSLSLNFDYNTAEKVTGSIELDGTKPEDLRNRIVRIFLNASLPTASGEPSTAKVTLATMLVGRATGHYEGSRWTCSAELKSPLVRYTEDELYKPRSISSGTRAKDFFDSVVEDYGGWCLWDGASNFKMPNRTIDVQSSVMEYVQEVCGAAKNEIGVDELGRIVVSPYTRPSLKDPSYEIPGGAKCVAFPGVDSEFNASELPNRVGVRIEWMSGEAEKSITVTKSAASSYLLSREKCGRWVTRALVLQNVDEADRTLDYANAKASQELSACIAAERRHTFKSLYMPYRIGDVVKGGFAPMKGKLLLVERIDITAKVGSALVMDTTVKEV